MVRRSWLPLGGPVKQNIAMQFLGKKNLFGAFCVGVNQTPSGFGARLMITSVAGWGGDCI